jgi:hypothetical protein
MTLLSEVFVMKKILAKCGCLCLGVLLLVSCGTTDKLFRDHVIYQEVAALRVGVTEKAVAHFFAPPPEFAWWVKTSDGHRYGVRLYTVRKGYFCQNEESFAASGSFMACTLEEDPACTQTCVEPQKPERRLMLVYQEPKGSPTHTLLSWGWIDDHRYQRIGGRRISASVFRAVDKHLTDVGCRADRSLSECHW